MTLQNLKDRVTVTWYGYGAYKVVVTYRNNKFSCLSHDSCAYDRIKYSDGYAPRTVLSGYTLKQAYESFYCFCLSSYGIIYE